MASAAKLQAVDAGVEVPANDLIVTAPHVLVAMSAVMAEIGKTGIAKGHKNEQQNYKFRGIDDVYNELNALMAANQLLMIPTKVVAQYDEVTTSNNKVMQYARLTVGWTMASARDGSTQPMETVGEAMDSGDKASNKAQSAAMKYAALMVFMIPTEGDNDTENSSPERGSGRNDQPTPSGTSAGAGKRLSSAEAKRQGLDKQLRDAIWGCTTHDELEAWKKDFGKHTAQIPTAWLDSVRNDVILRGEEIDKGQGEPGPSVIRQAALTAMDMCKSEDALAAWGKTNAEAIKQMDDADRVAVRAAYQQLMDRLRDDQAKTTTRAPLTTSEPGASDFHREGLAAIASAQTEAELRKWSDTTTAEMQSCSQEDYEALSFAFKERAEAIRAEAR